MQFTVDSSRCIQQVSSFTLSAYGSVMSRETHVCVCVCVPSVARTQILDLSKEQCAIRRDARSFLHSPSAFEFNNIRALENRSIVSCVCVCTLLANKSVSHCRCYCQCVVVVLIWILNQRHLHCKLVGLHCMLNRARSTAHTRTYTDTECG